MKKSVVALVTVALLATACSDKTKSAKSKFIKDYAISYKIDESKKIITDELAKKNYHLVTNYDNTKDALKLKKMLYPNYTLEFNNPKITTKLLTCNPTMSVDLPVRVGLYNEINGKTHIVYTDPEYWSLKHNVKDAKCLQLLLLVKRDLEDLKDSLIKKADNETK